MGVRAGLAAGTALRSAPEPPEGGMADTGGAFAQGPKSVAGCCVRVAPLLVVALYSAACSEGGTLPQM